MSKPHGRNKDNHDATRRLFLEIAHDYFARDGYNSTSTNDIVRDAEMARGALYHHFKNKEDLFRAVVKEKVQQSRDTVDQYFQDHADDIKNNPKDGLYTVIGFMIDASQDDATRRLVLIESQSALPHSDRRDLMKDSFYPLLKHFMDEIGITKNHSDSVIDALLIGLMGYITESARSFEYCDSDEERAAQAAAIKESIKALLDPFLSH